MARIYVTDKDEVREIKCIAAGQDFMNEILTGANGGNKYGTERDDADWQMCEADFCWWEEWAYRETRISARAEELGEDAVEEVVRISEEHGGDLDSAQDAQERYLRI